VFDVSERLAQGANGFGGEVKVNVNADVDVASGGSAGE
jgi:hypothetical protein